MLTFSQMSLKTKTLVARCAGALALISWICFIELYIYLDYTRPHKIDVAVGRIFSLNNHSSIAYLTHSEHAFLYAFAYLAGAFFIVAAVFYNAAKATNVDRFRK
jgi:hypothetical protein